MRKYFILAGCLFIASVAHAQNPNTDNGYIPGHAYQSNDIDVVDVGGGNMTLKIPIRSYKQEGSQSVDYYLYFPGKHFEAMNSADGEIGMAGEWAWVDPRDPSPWNDPLNSGYYGGVYLMNNQDWHGGYPTVYGLEDMSPDGARHLFINTNEPLDPGYTPWPSADASGYAINYNGIQDPEGIGHGTGSYTDRNYPTVPSVNGTDLSGRILPYTNTDGAPGVPAANTSACPGAATEAFDMYFPGAVYNPSAGGNYDTYIFCYAPVAISTSFLQDGVTEFDKTLQFLQAVVLPNGQSWQFQYDGYGDLTQVTYPTGAYTTYSYVTMSPECVVGDQTTPSSRYLVEKTEHSLDAPPATWQYSIGRAGGYASSFPIVVPADAQSGTSGLTLYGQIITPEGVTQTYLFAAQGSELCPSYEEGFLDGKGSGRITVNTITGYTALDPNGPLPLSGYTYSPRFVATWGPNQPPTATSKFYDEEYTQVIPSDPDPGEMPQYVYLSHGTVIAEFTYPYTGPLNFSQLAGFPPISLAVLWNAGEDSTGLAVDTYMGSPTGYPFPVTYPTGSLPSGVSKYVETHYEYQSNTTVAQDNLVSLVSNKTTYDSSRNVVAQTVNTYDDGDSNTLSLSVPNVYAPGGYSSLEWPGFLASTSTWLSGSNVWPSSNLSAITQTFTPDSGVNAHAEVASATDGAGNTTSYTRDSNGVNIIAVTRGEHTVQVDCGYNWAYGGPDPVYCPTFVGGQTIQSTYDPGTGQIATQTDENGNTTSYTYGPMARLIKVQPPAIAAGQPEVDLCYTDLQSCPIVGSTPLTIVSQTKQSTSGTPVTISQSYDAFGRPIKSVLYDSTGPIETDTAYDFLGRKISVSNPYRSTSDPTYGVTTYAYPNSATAEVDTTTPDGTITTETPTLGVDVITGPNPETKTLDIFGNTVSVSRSIGSGTYTYDLLNNLTSANGRLFTYDPASRLLTSNNLETGTISYGYDGANNLLYKYDARVATFMTYDTLNRVTTKTYNAGTSAFATPASCYQYDNPAAGANGIGRLWIEWTQSGSCTFTTPASTNPPANAITSRTITYDSGGRTASEIRCLGSTKCVQTVNTYDLAGNLTQYTTQQLTNPSAPGSYPVTVTNVYDSANRLQQVFSQMNPALSPVSMYYVSAFSPAGPTSTNIGSTMTTTHTYDLMMRPTGAVTTLQ